MPRAKQRTPELRGRVLSVAVEVLTEDGASGFTTRRVAERAKTSVPAIYELFTDKAGLIREVYFEGFRRLACSMAQVPETPDSVGDLEQLIPVFRHFCLDYPALARVMFSKPFQDLDPESEDLAATPVVRDILIRKVGRCVDDGRLHGNPVDIAHVLLALAQGLAVQEGGRWLGSGESVNRRWTVGIRSVLRGFSM